MRWQVRLAELRHRRGEQGDAPALAVTWITLAGLIDLHMAADEAVCGPAIYGTGPHGRDLAREARDAHSDIGEIIRATSQYPPGSALWWAWSPRPWPPGPGTCTARSTVRWPTPPDPGRRHRAAPGGPCLRPSRLRLPGLHA
jgi:hypothetical protein